MINWFNHMYPYGNLHELNLDWVIATVKRGEKDIADFIGINTIKYADPILWNIESQYEANTVVVDGQTGNAYISVKAVPSGVHLNRTEYWTQIYNYSNVVDTLREQIAHNEGDTTTATQPFAVDDLVFVRGLLYKVIAPMIAGDSFVENSNIVKTTIEEEMKLVSVAIQNEALARANADTQLQTNIDNEVLARTNADTQLQTNIDNEVLARTNADTQLHNEIQSIILTQYYVTPEMFGAIGDGEIDDTQAILNAITENKPLYLKNTYKVTSPLVFTDCIIFGSGKLIYDGSYTRHLITINGVCLLNDFELDCNNKCALGVFVQETKNALINNVHVSNCNNVTTDNYSCCGIYVLKCNNAYITNAVVKNVNRVTSQAGVRSSCGIAVLCINNATISNCYVENIHSAVESEECDGIFVSFTETPINNHAVISNNTVINCTGRFIKSQCRTVKIDSNKCINNVTFSSTRYFQPFSPQYGDFEVINNYVNLGSTYERSFTHLISSSMSEYNSNMICTIKGNTFIVDSVATNQRARSLLYIGISGENLTCHVLCDITDNDIRTPTESVLYITGTSTNNLNGKVKIENNRFNIYQVVENYIGSDINDIYFIVQHNTFTFANARFSSETLAFNMLILKNNIGINEALNNYPIDYTNLVLCDIYYRGAVQAMQNVPSDMGNGTCLYLNKGRNFAKYCDIAHQTTVGLLGF